MCIVQEHHLQRAISAQQVYGDKHAMVIPVPEAVISKEAYNNIYKENHRMPNKYVTNNGKFALILFVFILPLTKWFLKFCYGVHQRMQFICTGVSKS